MLDLCVYTYYLLALQCFDVKLIFIAWTVVDVDRWTASEADARVCVGLGGEEQGRTLYSEGEDERAE